MWQHSDTGGAWCHVSRVFVQLFCTQASHNSVYAFQYWDTYLPELNKADSKRIKYTATVRLADLSLKTGNKLKELPRLRLKEEKYALQSHYCLSHTKLTYYHVCLHFRPSQEVPFFSESWLCRFLPARSGFFILYDLINSWRIMNNLLIIDFSWSATWKQMIEDSLGGFLRPHPDRHHWALR